MEVDVIQVVGRPVDRCELERPVVVVVVVVVVLVVGSVVVVVREPNTRPSPVGSVTVVPPPVVSV